MYKAYSLLTALLLFATGSVALTKEGKEALTRVASALKNHKFPAVIEGHTDNVPVVKPASLRKFPRGNIELSAQRALSVWQFLVQSGKIEKTVDDGVRRKVLVYQ